MVATGKVRNVRRNASRKARLTDLGLVVLGSLLALTTCSGPGEDLSASVIRAYITGYSYFDNTPPGSARISHPVVHAVAGGTGTYEDPVTVAVGHVRVAGDHRLDWPAGTRFYLPNLRRYLIVEDTCGDGDRPQETGCHSGYPADASTWLDVWVGGEGGTRADAKRCMAAFTGVWDVLVDPPVKLAVDPGDIYAPTARDGHPDGCAKQYGNDIVRAG